MNQPLLILALLAALSCCQAAPAQQSHDAAVVQSTPGCSQLTVSDDHGSLMVVRGPDGQITAVRDGSVVPADRVRREGDHLRILDESGGTVYDIRATPDGGLVYPYDAKVGMLWATPAASGAFFASSTPRKVIGVTVDAVDAALASQLDIDPESAFVISDVFSGMPAEEAGLQAHDVVVSIQDEKPATVAKLREAMMDKQPGDKIRLGVLRHGQSLEVEVGVAEERSPRLLFKGDDQGVGTAYSQIQTLTDSVHRQQAELEAARDRLADLREQLKEANAALDEAREGLTPGDDASQELVQRRKAEVDALRAELAQQQDRIRNSAATMQLLDLSGGRRALVLPPNSSAFGDMAPAAVPGDMDERLRSMEERLSRLEDLLEKLVKSDADK